MPIEEQLKASLEESGERKVADEALRASEERFRQLAENIHEVFWLLDVVQQKVIYVSPAYEEIWGRSCASLYASPTPWPDSVHPDDLERVRQVVTTSQTTGTYDEEFRIVRPDNSIRWIRERAFPVRDATGAVYRMAGVAKDITEQKQSDEELRGSEARFRTIFEQAAIGIALVAITDGRIIRCNQALAEMLGHSVDELVHLTVEDISQADDYVDDREQWEKMVTDATARYQMEKRYRRKDGQLIWGLLTASVVRDSAGGPLFIIGMVEDITNRKRAEQAVRENATFTEDVLNSLTAHVVVLDEQGAIIAVNEAWRRFARDHGAGAPDSIGHNYLTVASELVMRDHPAGAAEATAGIRAVLAGGRTSFTLEYPGHGPGQTRWFRLHVSPLTGGRRGVVVSHHDISELKQGMEALRASEQRFKALFEQAAVGVAQTDAGTGRFVQVNQRFCEIVGRNRQELEQLTFAGITHPQDIGRDLDAMRKLKAGAIREFTQEKRYLRKDLSEVWASLTVSPMWTPGETPDYCIAIVQDITERKRLEEHFLQAQKMEALGRFSGGVAHDFNNILAAIVGYAELCQMNLKDNPVVREHLGAVMQAAIRATDLVRQILTFSRQQPQERRAIQLRPVVLESLKLLRATIPSTIEFDTSLAADAPTVLANANQIHQVLVNLGTNAWHAMKDRTGRLQVKLERWVVDVAQAAAQPRLRPGLYARVSVTDTGCGMDQATLRRIFEPFFTTKPPGEGTGLGLAVVHGIMDNHDGAVTVYSQPGEGTVFHLYFPAHGGEATMVAAEAGPVPRGQGERILVVDDEELLARLMQQALGTLGYVVETATQPATALAMVRTDPQRFALVLTDQTMPGMAGLVLASQLLKIRPGLPIILMTGYSLSLTAERVEAAGIHQLLFKPTTIHALGTAVHAALTARPIP